MKHDLKYILAIVIVLFASCNTNQKKETAQQQQNTLVFSQGEKIKNDNFTGTAYLKTLIDADSLNSISVGNVTFEPGARSRWHSHPAGQILLVIDGVGYYQEKGKFKKILHKGDAIKCPPNTPHWHGASADTAFVQVAITGREKGETVWLNVVTDEEYNASGRN
ncbi:MAG: cupin domain-containing protein [Sphingobacteriales bacterium]|nr:cupin domain-containing protein [Sphingobacteriales bacterium]